MVMFYEVLLRLHYGYILIIFWPLLGLQHQHGERVCYGCHGSQERINLSAIPSAPRIFFQPLISHLAYPGFSKQCEQRDNWHHRQNQQCNHLPKFPSLHSLVAQNQAWPSQVYSFLVTGAMLLLSRNIVYVVSTIYTDIHMNGVLWIWTISSASDLPHYDLS